MLIEMAKIFESFRRSHGVYTAFEDFIELTAIIISNGVDKYQKPKRDERYEQVIEKYSDEEISEFNQLSILLKSAMRDKPDDYLGRLFMELELSDHWKGQFFTPIGVARLVAEMTVRESIAEFRKKGSITANDPAVGGGATMIAVYSIIKDMHLNPQNIMRVVAQDLDKKAVHMAYVQLSLLGVNATVFHGDTLQEEIKDVWYTPGYFMNWGYGEIEVAETTQLSFF